MNLAVGNTCIVYDYSQNKEMPRALYQGLEYIKFILYKRWFNMGPKEAMVNLQKYVDLNRKDNINFEVEFNYLYTNGGICGWNKIPYKTFYNIISGKQRVDFNGNLTGN